MHGGHHTPPPTCNFYTGPPPIEKHVPRTTWCEHGGLSAQKRSHREGKLAPHVQTKLSYIDRLLAEPRELLSRRGLFGAGCTPPLRRLHLNGLHALLHLPTTKTDASKLPRPRVEKEKYKNKKRKKNGAKSTRRERMKACVRERRKSTRGTQKRDANS